MSSAVSYAYRVREEELRRQRELQAARDALRSAALRHERLRQRATEQQQLWGNSISLPDRLTVSTESSDAAQLRAAAQRLESEITDAEKRLDEEIVGARIAALREGTAATRPEASRPVSAGEAIERSRRTRPAAAEPATGEEEGGDQGALEETLSRVVSKLDASAPGEAVVRVREAARLVRESSSASARQQGVDALRLLVQEANVEAREKRSREAALDRGEVRLNGFDGPQAAAARRLFAEIRDGQRDAPSDLEATVDAAIEAETRTQEAGYVAAELRGALEGLGYELGPEFGTALLKEGFTEFTRAGWDGYAVRVRTGGPPPRLNFNVVRGSATRPDQAARDLEVEQEFCDRQPRVLERLARAGIDTERTRIVEPGERELQVVEGFGESAGAEVSRSAARKMDR
jgi:hypothetical protein